MAWFRRLAGLRYVMATVTTLGLMGSPTRTAAAQALGDARTDARAQDAQGPGNPRRNEPTPDFLVGRPRSTLGLRVMWLRARAHSDVFDFIRQRLTVGPRDFDRPGVVMDYGYAVGSRLDVVGSFDYSRSTASSEYRAFVDNNRQAIEQQTTLSTASVTLGARVHLTARGREVGRLAWIPARFTPYVGAGAGLIRHHFEQTGDFVDFQTLRVFTDIFRSSGWAPTGYASGGLNVNLTRALSVAAEGRYGWASDELGSDFEGFAPIDLAGFSITGGINVVF